MNGHRQIPMLGRPPLGAVTTLGAGESITTISSALSDAADAVNNMPNACVMDGTVRAFQQAWNDAGGSPQLVTDDKFGTNTDAALAQVTGGGGGVLGPTPGACRSFVTPGGTPVPSPSPSPSPAPTPGPIQPTPPGTLTTGGMSTTMKWIVGGLLAAAVLAIGWMLLHPKHRAKRAARRAFRHARRAHRMAHRRR
jgi:hypothetical protein